MTGHQNRSLPNVLLTGATGLVGAELVDRFDRPIVTSRNRAKTLNRFGDLVSEVIEWEPANEVIKIPHHLKIDSVVNLMGEPIGEGRWTPEKKARITNSRVQGTRNLIEGLKRLETLPKTFVSASAIGYYGEDDENSFDETSSPGDGFLADLVQQWELEAKRAEEFGANVVLLRTGLVLGTKGGVLKKMLPIFRWGLGGKLASGKQWMSWIHIEDLLRLILASAKGDFNGKETQVIVNATAPNPVRNIEFTKKLGSILGRPAILPVPKFALRLALGEFAPYTIASQKVSAKKATELGFRFEFEELEHALRDLLGKLPESES